jgi:hypothetical protein
MHPEFPLRKGTDPEAIYSLFDFKNNVMKIITKSPN